MADRTQLLIGLSGSIGAGKSEFARHLEAAHGFVRIAFGDAIKEEVARFLRRTIKMHLAAIGKGFTNEEGWDHLIHDLLYVYRDDFARALLQEWGMMRRAQHPDYWVQVWLLRARGHARVVNDNVRMRGEAEAIVGLGGRLIKIVRPDSPTAPPAAAADPTEHGLDDWNEWDLLVGNEGSLEALRAKADACVAALCS